MSREFWFFFWISISKSCSRIEIWWLIASFSAWIACCFRYSSNNYFFRAFIWIFSSTLSCSLYELILDFSFTRSLLVSFKALYLKMTSSMLLKLSPAAAFLSFTTDSKNSVNGLCLSISYSFNLSSCSFRCFRCSKSLSSLALASIKTCSLARSSSHFFLFMELSSSFLVCSVTFCMIFYFSAAYCCLWTSSSLAFLMISSFWFTNASSVSLSSLSFCRSRTAWSGLWLRTVKARTLLRSSSLILYFWFFWVSLLILLNSFSISI